MKRKMKKIKNDFTPSPYKYIIIFLVVFITVSLTSYVLLTDFENKINDQNIQYVECAVVDKYITNDSIPQYMIVCNDNNTYEIANDRASKKMFDNINIGYHYHFIVRQPIDKNDSILIVQVYNETGEYIV